MNKLLVLIILALIVLAIGFGTGYLRIGNEQKDFEQLEKLEQTYLVKNGFSANSALMSDYISALSELNSKSSMGAGRVIQAELYSAQTFYYYNKAITESTSNDYQTIKCSSTQTKSIISSIKLASEYATKAINSINSLTQTEQAKLRPNQLETLKNYSTQINELKKFFEEKC